MSNQPNNYKSSGVGTTPVTLVTASQVIALIGGNICNTTGGQIKVDLYITNGGSNYYFLRNFPIDAYQSFSVFGADFKHFLISGDALNFVSYSANSCDIIISSYEGAA